MRLIHSKYLALRIKPSEVGLMARRQALGGSVPERVVKKKTFSLPKGEHSPENAGPFADNFAGTGNAPIPFNGMIAYILQLTGDTARASAIRKSLAATPDTTWLIDLARAYAYLATDTWVGRSGAYAIQEENDPFLRIIEGSLTNVIGLPMESLARAFAWLSTLSSRSA